MESIIKINHDPISPQFKQGDLVFKADDRLVVMVTGPGKTEAMFTGVIMHSLVDEDHGKTENFGKPFFQVFHGEITLKQ